MQLSSELSNYIDSIASESTLINDARKEDLNLLSQIIFQALEEKGAVNITAICTHNSRRSQLAEVWIRVGAIYFGLSGIQSYSGGTEATAFNHRMVSALKKKRFPLKMVEEGSNPQYILQIGETTTQQRLFSKKYSHSFNPQKDYIAIMVCDHADENCPIVFGADKRISLNYKDPKEYDDSPGEQQAYLDKIDEIGREILYVLARLK